MNSISSRTRAFLAAGLIGAAALVCHPAQAWWRGGFFVGVAPVPLVVGPPVVYPPAYTPAPAPQAQAAPQKGQQQQAVAYGSTCYAGFYACPVPAYTPVGNTCSCPGIGAPSFGTAH
jgi:hypothetical protein